MFDDEYKASLDDFKISHTTDYSARAPELGDARRGYETWAEERKTAAAKPKASPAALARLAADPTLAGDFEKMFGYLPETQP